MRRFSLFILLIPMLSFASSVRFVAEDLPPLHFIDTQGKSQGALVELSRAMMDIAKIDGQVEIMPMARAFNDTQNTTNTIMMSLLNTPTRTDSFSWIGASYRADAYLVSRADYQPQTHLFEQLNDSVCTIRGYFSEQFLKQHGYIENKTLHLASNAKSLWQMLFKKRCNFVLTNTHALELELTSLNIKPTSVKRAIKVKNFPSTLYFAANKRLPSPLKNKLTAALLHLKKSGEYQKIMEKWQLKQ